MADAVKLWDKGFKVDEKIDKFTVGHDREMDLYLSQYDIMGTMAHITMLSENGLLPKEDLAVLLPELKALYAEAKEGRFEIEDGIEDVHSQVELMLTRKLGDLGKKVHTGRSRNDQVMVDLKLFSRAEIEKTVRKMESVFEVLQRKSEEYRDVIIPHYAVAAVKPRRRVELFFKHELLTGQLDAPDPVEREKEVVAVLEGLHKAVPAPVEEFYKAWLHQHRGLVFGCVAAVYDPYPDAVLHRLDESVKVLTVGGDGFEDDSVGHGLALAQD